MNCTDLWSPYPCWSFPCRTGHRPGTKFQIPANRAHAVRARHQLWQRVLCGTQAGSKPQIAPNRAISQIQPWAISASCLVIHGRGSIVDQWRVDPCLTKEFSRLMLRISLEDSHESKCGASIQSIHVQQELGCSCMNCMNQPECFTNPQCRQVLLCLWGSCLDLRYVWCLAGLLNDATDVSSQAATMEGSWPQQGHDGRHYLMARRTNSDSMVIRLEHYDTTILSGAITQSLSMTADNSGYESLLIIM